MTALRLSRRAVLGARSPSQCRSLHATSTLGTAPCGGLMEPDARTDPATEILDHFGGPSNVEHLRRIARDFRTDTITMPTDAQVLFAQRASRGDDVEQEDATTTALEARVAALAGKEAGLFCASSTMSNQLAIRSTLSQPPFSIVSDIRSHTFIYEAGGAALFSQATTYPARPSNKLYLTAEDVADVLVLGSDIHTAPTQLITLENTINGIIHPQEEVERISELASGHGIPMHLDGARVWNAAAAEVERLGLDACSEADKTEVISRLLAPFATASLCLSKGLGAPIGSILVGSKEQIERARWFRKMFGGGWRQTGGIAAQADWAVSYHFPRLAGTHALARRLAGGLQAAGCDILAPVDTNMVFFDAGPLGLTFETVKDALAALPEPIRLGSNRCVVHHQTSPAAVDDFVDEVKRLAEGVPASERHLHGKKAEMGYR